jgi:long-chain acyl-CoA synthetase
MAVVVLKDAYRGSVTELEVRDFCRQQLPPYAVPKIVEFRDELPLTVSEKVFKKVLREQAIARMSVEKED